MASVELTAASAPAPARREVIRRHGLMVRLTHWVNALAIFLLVGTGLNIFNAHPRLYWGRAGENADPAWLSIGARQAADGAPRGVLQLGALRLDTTGLLGWSQSHGQGVARAWPDWLTLPSFTDLADARHWHLFLAWVLVGNGLVYLAWGLGSGHLRRDLWPTRADLRALPRDVWDHLRLRHPRGEAAKRYGILQRLAYLGFVGAAAGMAVTGLTLSPGINAAFPWTLDLLGGRQSARSLHFLCMAAIVLFITVHLIEVVLAGPLNEVRSMITGRYAVPRERER